MTPDQKFLHDVVRLAENITPPGQSGEWYQLPPLGSVCQVIKVARYGDELEVVGYMTYDTCRHCERPFTGLPPWGGHRAGCDYAVDCR